MADELSNAQAAEAPILEPASSQPPDGEENTLGSEEALTGIGDPGSEKTVLDKALEAAGGDPETQAQSVGLKPLKADGASGESVDLDFLLDIPLQVTVQIGRTKMLINDLLQLGQGSVIELDKLNSDSSFDVLINDKIIARGEIVVVNDRFGVRLTDIISPMERVEHIA